VLANDGRTSRSPVREKRFRPSLTTLDRMLAERRRPCKGAALDPLPQGREQLPAHLAFAYDRDLAAAAADSEEQVAAKVAQWERQQGLEPRDWRAIGADARRDDY
jgi:hypothetical protein